MDNIHIFSDFRLRVGETRESKTRKFADTVASSYQWKQISWTLIKSLVFSVLSTGKIIVK